MRGGPFREYGVVRQQLVAPTLSSRSKSSHTSRQVMLWHFWQRPTCLNKSLVFKWHTVEKTTTIPARTQKTENSNLHGFEVHRPSSKGTKLLFQIIKAIINQFTKKKMYRPHAHMHAFHEWSGFKNQV